MEQDRKLDTALLQSGKFKDALVSLMDWLGETEEMVASQKAPSTDYKVQGDGCTGWGMSTRPHVWCVCKVWGLASQKPSSTHYKVL